MNDKNYQAIVDALDLLGSGKHAISNGKITALNVAIEAGISKATLYRYFDRVEQLRKGFESIRRRGINFEDEAPDTPVRAYLHVKTEIKHLRDELATEKRRSTESDRLKSHQLLVLWSENERLKNEINRLSRALERYSNVVLLPNEDT
jgi:AcrR family transcriptional regulator